MNILRGSTIGAAGKYRGRHKNQHDSNDAMNWQGKAFGALLGVLAGGPAGALAGAFIGHLFDAQSGAKKLRANPAEAGSVAVQEAFFRATFQLMGHVAKADGRVSEDDIRAARAMMAELRLGEREVQLAIELFTQGKAQ